MHDEKITLIKNFLNTIKAANKELTKKEAFKDLLNRLYSEDRDIRTIIDSITKGAERTVLNIPRKDKVHKGSADTLYNKIIIEFENDLKVTYKHAKEQLAGYLLGQYNSGEGYNFTLIASDFISWKVFTPDISQIDKLSSLNEEDLILNELPDSSFSLNEKNVEEFYYWIDRFLFREEKQKATLKRIEESFGYNSIIFLECYRHLNLHFTELKKYGEVQVAQEQWRKFLSIAYGSFDGDESHFLIHTYLSVFAKMLAYAVVSNDDFIDDDQLIGIIDGSIFHKYNLRNFVDNDFFHWVKSERNFKRLKKIFRLIAQEISAFDFTNVEEDILKGVYQELIDLDTRHTLGEYYTPDWLCERIVNEYEFTLKDKILDPSCGSGSFLRAIIHRIRKNNPGVSAEIINNNVYGIDIHPLSVLIAKTTVLLALGKDVINSQKPVHINVILANTLLAPDGVESLFGSELKMYIDKEQLILDSKILDDVDLFDEALEVCEELADLTVNAPLINENEFFSTLSKKYSKVKINREISNDFYKIHRSFKTVKEKGRDGIWKFIVQNLYKPYFLSRTFNYVIGNPPWFTYSSIKNQDYQNQLSDLAINYNVKPARVANFPHLEIAAIFMSYCSSYFLKDDGKLAFVLPRSFFSADHHENTRTGQAVGFKIEHLWDLKDVNPLFRVPSSVIFVKKVNKKVKRELPVSGLKGLEISGKLPIHNCNLNVAKDKLNESVVTWYLAKQGKSTAFSQKKSKANQKENPYKNEFKQGATIVPRSFYFVELTQETPPDFIDRVINVKTAESIIPDAKPPWKSTTLKGRIESKFLYRTAISKSILPFTLYKPDLVVLPVTISTDELEENKIKLLGSGDLRSEGYLHAAKWFKDAEHYWDLCKTEKNSKITFENYLNWNNKLTIQKIETPFLVLYNSSAKDANATVVIRKDIDLPFFAESKTYVFYSNSLDECFYLTSILNSKLANTKIKDFQTSGLFGARDIHKKILDVYFPKFEQNNELHNQLVELSKTSHKKSAEYLSLYPPQGDLSAIQLGKMRLNIKNYISKELLEIDKIVKKIIE